jgi:ABC-type multidrug transport system ATPase subunit
VLLVTHYADEAERLCDRVALIQAGRVAACGRPLELISAAAPFSGAGRAARITLDDAIVALTSDRPASPQLTGDGLTGDRLTTGAFSTGETS